MGGFEIMGGAGGGVGRSMDEGGRGYSKVVEVTID